MRTRSYNNYKNPIPENLFKNCKNVTSFKNTLTFRDLDINKDKIITIFISEGILPRNFLSLELPQNQLPRLKNESKS